MIEEILKIENPTNAIIELDTKLNEKSNYGNKITELTEGEKVVLLVENLEREINNGGFNQFFFNSSGDFALETLNSLKKIEAYKTAEIVSKAFNEWPNAIVPKDRSERQNTIEEIEGKANEVWENCDNDFYKYEEDITLLLLSYVKANMNEFK